MTEVEQARNLRKRFLKAAYDLGTTRPGRVVGLDEIAEEMQQYMDTSSPYFMDRLTDIASYLHELGFIRKQTSEYQIMSITSTGIGEVERQAASESLPPTVQSMPSRETQFRHRERRRRFLAAIYDLAGGSPNQIVYWPSVAPSLGWDAENKDHLGEALGSWVSPEPTLMVTSRR